MNLVDINRIVVEDSSPLVASLREQKTDRDSQLFISAPKPMSSELKPPLTEFQRLARAKQRKKDLEEQQRRLTAQLRRYELQASSFLRKTYFRKIQSLRRNEVVKKKIVFSQERQQAIRNFQQRQHQMTAQVRQAKRAAEQSQYQLENSKQERLKALRNSNLNEKSRLQQQRAQLNAQAFRARRQSFNQQRAFQQSAMGRRRALREIKEGIAKQNYVMKIKRQLDTLANYSNMLEQLNDIQRKAYQCMMESSQLSKRTEGQLRGLRSQSFVTEWL